MPRLPLRHLLLAALVAGHLLLSLLAVVPGHLSVDEGTYHFMVRSWSRGHGVEVWNGYREMPSPELAAAATLSVEDGRLVAVPPELYPLLALPFYALLGYRGLFLLNALAFLALLALTRDIALRLSGDRALALDAALLLGLATFLWDYSQAAWPHATSALFVLAAFAAAVRALQETSPRRGAAWAAAAGLLAGLAPGIRLDGAFALPVLQLPFLFLRPPQWGRAAAFAAGTLPPLVALAAVNAAKFGVWTPFTYGREGGGANTGVAPYLPLLAAGGLVVGAAWLVSRRRTVERWAPRLAGRRGGLLAAAALAAAAALVLALPPLRDLAARFADGAAQLLVDLRFRDLDVAEPAMARSPGGAVIYIGGFKKSLLQSCPYLAALALPIGAARTERRLRAPVLLLSLVPAAFVAPYALFAWHGGLSLNLRYFVPLLPFAAILAALAARRLAAAPGRLVPWALLAGAGAAVPLAATWALAGLRLDRAEPLLLDLPLGLAASLAVLAAALLLLRGDRPLLRRAAAAVFAAAVAWSVVVTFAYDVPLARRQRAYNLGPAHAALPVVEPDSIFFAPYPDPYFGLIEVERLRLAIPFRDRFRDFRPLVDLHLAAGRPVYASLPLAAWRGIGQQGLLRGLRLRPLLPDGSVVRIEAAPPDAGTPSPEAPPGG